MSEGSRSQRSGEQREGKIGLCSPSFRPEERSNLPVDFNGVRKERVLEPHQQAAAERDRHKDSNQDR